MRRLLLLPILFLAVSGWSAASEAFDPQATVTLDLRDARLTDVLTNLGAIANLPVVIEPGIEGKVTIKLENVPYIKSPCGSRTASSSPHALPKRWPWRRLCQRSSAERRGFCSRITPRRRRILRLC